MSVAISIEEFFLNTRLKIKKIIIKIIIKKIKIKKSTSNQKGHPTTPGNLLH